MTTHHINEHERYPVYMISSEGRPTIDLTDEELTDYHNACDHWEAWQDRLAEVFLADEPSHFYRAKPEQTMTKNNRFPNRCNHVASPLGQPQQCQRPRNHEGEHDYGNAAIRPHK